MNLILSPASSTFLYLVRIFAAQAVLIGHLYDKNPPFIQDISVLTLFLLSGFLIPYSVSKKKERGEYTFLDYFINRFSRIYSVFIPAIILVVLLDFIHLKTNSLTYDYHIAFNVKTFVTNLLMLNYFPSIPFGSAKPFWTLGIWWWLYLSYGWLALKSKLKKKSKLLSICIALLFLIIPVYSLFAGRGKGLSLIWLMGVIIFYTLNKLKLKLLHSIILGLVFFTLSLWRISITKLSYEFIFILLLSLSLFFLLNTLQQFKHKLNSRVLIFFSSYTFTLYLTHYSLISLLSDFPKPVLFVICNLLAVILAQFTEIKYKFLANKLKRIFSKLSCYNNIL